MAEPLWMQMFSLSSFPVRASHALCMCFTVSYLKKKKKKTSAMCSYTSLILAYFFVCLFLQ